MSVFKSLKARLSKKATPENSTEDTSTTSGVMDEDSTVHGILTGDFPDGYPNTDHVATVDTAMAAPPPSPLAPVDLTDPAQVTGVMEIAARIGEILIFSGSSNSDARAQVYLAAISMTPVTCAGILWASMSVWAGRLAGPRLWRSLLAGTIIILAMLVVHYSFGLLIGVFDSHVFSNNALWMYGSFLAGPVLGLAGGLSHKMPWLLLIVPLGLIAEPFVINSIPGSGFLPWPTVWAGWASGAVLIALGFGLGFYLWKVVIQPQVSSASVGNAAHNN